MKPSFASSKSKATRQYDKKQLLPLDAKVLQRFDENSHLMRVDGPDGKANYIADILVDDHSWRCDHNILGFGGRNT